MAVIGRWSWRVWAVVASAAAVGRGIGGGRAPGGSGVSSVGGAGWICGAGAVGRGRRVPGGGLGFGYIITGAVAAASVGTCYMV